MPNRTTLDRAFLEYFCCPPELAPSLTSDTLSSEASFFQFGRDLTCYGRHSIPRQSNGAHPYDALPEVSISGSELRLPFEIAEVMDNLRCERYAKISAGDKAQYFQAAYYLVRPLLWDSLRRHLQRFHLRDWRQIEFPKWPVDDSVDRLVTKVLALYIVAKNLSMLPFIWFWPDQASAAIAITHDVETVRGRDFCSSLMDLDSSFGIPSSFQFVPEQRYRLTNSFLTTVRDRGFEINIHDLNHDGKLFRDRDLFIRRADIIKQYATELGAQGFRSAILYRNLDWFEALDFFSYDMSVPNVAHLDPQRGGCCTVMPFYIGNILELPLTTTQDYTLFHILEKYSLDLWKQQIDDILRSHGLVTFNIHPDYLISSRARECYISLLEYLSQLRNQRRVWIAQPGEIAEWWRQRTKMRLVNRGDWRPEGHGSSRASVARATVEGEQLSFQFQQWESTLPVSHS